MPDTDKKTIMICEDEIDLLQLYEMVWWGIYNITMVDSGKECIERYIAEKNNGKKIHILLLDYKLGDMLGDIVACKISQLNGVKMILIIAHDLDEKMANDLLRRHCIVGTIKKSIRIPTMIQQIDNLSKDKPNSLMIIRKP